MLPKPLFNEIKRDLLSHLHKEQNLNGHNSTWTWHHPKLTKRFEAEFFAYLVKKGELEKTPDGYFKLPGTLAFAPLSFSTVMSVIKEVISQECMRCKKPRSKLDIMESAQLNGMCFSCWSILRDNQFLIEQGERMERELEDSFVNSELNK